MNKVTKQIEYVSMVAKHKRMVGVTIHNRGGAWAFPKSFCLTHRPEIRILFAQDHKKVYDLMRNQAIKHKANSLNIRVKDNDIIMDEGLIVQSGIYSLKLYGSLMSV